MPIYDYKCPVCEKKEEHFVRSSDPVPECSECKVQMNKLISGSHKIRPDGAANLPLGKRYQ